MSGKKRICGNDNHKKVLFSCIVQDKNVFCMFKDCWLKIYTQESWWLPIPVIEIAVRNDQQRAARGKRFLSDYISDQISPLKSLPTLLRRGATIDLMIFYSIHMLFMYLLYLMRTMRRCRTRLRSDSCSSLMVARARGRGQGRRHAVHTGAVPPPRRRQHMCGLLSPLFSLLFLLL